ncbi:MAG: TonB-dependent receptor [Burkholderiales bacterium]|nr:TonB-dependent receptor [Opitutaceae bacterium]
MAAAGSTNFLVAQTAEPAATPAPSATAPADEVVTLDALEVSDVPIEQNIMPTSRPFNSVFGTDQNITDIPRNVTIISREQLSAINIRDVRDFAKLTSSSYTRTNFGAPGNPDIRGQYGDVFQNGMRERTTSNGNGMPIDFNSVESVNIVKGPATAVQGASAYVGGFVDLVTKRPYFDEARGTAYVTVGSYDKLKWGLDYGAPISETLAYRISYSGEDSDGGYYQDDYKKTQALYGAVTWKPNDKYELFVNSQFNYMEYVENFGVNRPTQRFVDDGLYVTGTNVNAGTAASPADPQNAANVYNIINDVAFGPEVKLSRHSRLLKPGDNSLAKNYKLQAIQSVELDPDTKLVNNNLFTYTKRETYSSYYYQEVVDPAISFESRWEYQKEIDKLTINTGVAGRYTQVEAYNDYFFEPAGVWDLTQDHNFIDVNRSTIIGPGFAAPFGPYGFQQTVADGVRLPVPGYPGRYASPGTFNGDTNDSYSLSASPFVQTDYKVTNKLTAVAGGRIDFLHVNSVDPLYPSFLPPDGRETSETVGLPNVNGSLLYKVTPKMTSYFTYNYSRNTGGAIANGGGFSPGFTSDSLSQPSDLFEVGSKWALMDNKLFVGVALYDQTRVVKPQNSTAQPYHYQGAEFELNYQPNRNFFATFSYGAIDAEAAQAGFEAINTDISSLYPEIQAYSGPGNVRVQGLPKHQFNALVSYTLDNGFGASLNGTLHSEINNNWAGTIVIPWQFEIDASVFYKTKKGFDYRLSVTNITDERNLAPPNGVYGNESILVLPGAQAEFTVSYSF